MRLTSKARLFAVPFIFLFLTACGHINRETVLSGIEKDPQSGAFIKDVPFFPQNEYMCGPAALASVIGYWGGDAGMKEIASEVYDKTLRGALPIDLLLYAKGKGFEVSYYKGGLEDIRENIRKKTPLILFLNLGYDFYPVGHYIVVVGYDDGSKAILAHSALEKEKVIPYGEFLRSWAKTNYSTLLVKPKGGNEKD